MQFFGSDSRCRRFTPDLRAFFFASLIDGVNGAWKTPRPCCHSRARSGSWLFPGDGLQARARPRVSGIQTHVTAASRKATADIERAVAKPCDSASDPTTKGARADAIRPEL
jgi:hypothetical protein